MSQFNCQGTPHLPHACTEGLEVRTKRNSRGMAEQTAVTAAAQALLGKPLNRQIPDKVLPTDKETRKLNFKDLYMTSWAKLFKTPTPPIKQGSKAARN